MGNSRRAKRASEQRRRAATARSAATTTRTKRSWIGPVIGIGVAGVVVLLVVFIASDVTSNPQERPDPPAGVEVIAVDSPVHVEGDIQYDRHPPAGGIHNPVWLQCRAYDEPVRNENAVHALEHGAVWITYEPSLIDDAGIDTLEDEADRRQVIVSPYPGQGSPIVVTAWARQMRVDSPDDPRINQFVRSLMDETAPEAAASC